MSKYQIYRSQFVPDYKHVHKSRPVLVQELPTLEEAMELVRQLKTSMGFMWSFEIRRVKDDCHQSQPAHHHYYSALSRLGDGSVHERSKSGAVRQYCVMTEKLEHVEKARHRRALI